MGQYQHIEEMLYAYGKWRNRDLGGGRSGGSTMHTPTTEEFRLHLDAYGLDYKREHAFHPRRKWRFDFALPEDMVAVEIEGGAWIGGRHTRGSGFKADAEKYNEAALLGWKVLRFLPEHVKSGEAIKKTVEAVGGGL